MIKVSRRFCVSFVAAAAVVVSGVAVAQPQQNSCTPFEITVSGTVKPAWLGDHVAKQNECAKEFKCKTLAYNTFAKIDNEWEEQCATSFKSRQGFDATKGTVDCSISEMTGGTCNGTWDGNTNQCEVTITDMKGSCCCKQTLPPPPPSSGGGSTGTNGGSTAQINALSNLISSANNEELRIIADLLSGVQ